MPSYHFIKINVVRPRLLCNYFKPVSDRLNEISDDFYEASDYLFCNYYPQSISFDCVFTTSRPNLNKMYYHARPKSAMMLYIYI